jgi:hypothetical protein
VNTWKTRLEAAHARAYQSPNETLLSKGDNRDQLVGRFNIHSEATSILLPKRIMKPNPIKFRCLHVFMERPLHSLAHQISVGQGSSSLSNGINNHLGIRSRPNGDNTSIAHTKIPSPIDSQPVVHHTAHIIRPHIVGACVVIDAVCCVTNTLSRLIQIPKTPLSNRVHVVRNRLSPKYQLLHKANLAREDIEVK